MFKGKEDIKEKPQSLHLDFTIEAGDFGTFDCCYKSEAIAEVFRDYFDSIFPGRPDRAEYEITNIEQADKFGITLDDLIRRHRKLRDDAVELYTSRAIEFFTSKLGSAFKDALIPLFMESALETYESLKKQGIRRKKLIMVLPDIDRPGLTKIALQLSQQAAKRRLGIKRGGKKAKYDLSNLHHYYEMETHPNAKGAKNLYKQHKDEANWHEIVKLKYPDMPDDLIQRLPARKAKLPDRLNQKLVKNGGHTSQPSEIALEWAARLCGAPSYTYTLEHLWKAKRQQGNTNQKKGRRQTKTEKTLGFK